MAPTLLYSFRRCPYAIRARLALLYSDVQYTKQEVSFKDKPAHMLEISPKGTVPVLQLHNGRVIDESLDIAIWALEQNDPQNLLLSEGERAAIMQLIARNDGEFKHWLDHYKYADRHPEENPEYYRSQGEVFLQSLEILLSNSAFLMGDKASLADITIVPFVRQFAHVDKTWFEQTPYPSLQRWLQHWLSSEEFIQVMAKDPKQN